MVHCLGDLGLSRINREGHGMEGGSSRELLEDGRRKRKGGPITMTRLFLRDEQGYTTCKCNTCNVNIQYLQTDVRQFHDTLWGDTILYVKCPVCEKRVKI